MSKKAIIILASVVFLVASIAYDFYAKQEFLKHKESVSKEMVEVENIIALKKLWSATGLKKKIERVINSLPDKRVKFKRKSFELVANNLSYKELNHALNKFASMPLRFKKLHIKKVGNNFNLECLCEW